MSYTFDPGALHGVVLENVAQARLKHLDPSEQLVDLLARLGAAFPGKVAADLEWVSVSAGFGTQATAILHVTPSEYLVITGSPQATSGVSGRLTCTLHDYVLMGQLNVSRGDDVKGRTLTPGHVCQLQPAENLTFAIDEQAWMLEYARGFVPAMFLMPIWATLFSTLDVPSLWDLVRIATRRMAIDWLGWTPKNRWRNWMGNQKAAPLQIRRPVSLAAMQQIVREAKGQGRRVRAFGSSHSWTRLAPSTDVMVDMTGLDQLVAVDLDKKQITVEAGMRLDRAIAFAWSHGWWIPSTSAIKEVTVGGLAATGSHGTGMKSATFSDNIVAVTFVDGAGARRTIDESDPDALLAARVSLGALGLVHTLTLQCELGGVMRSEVKQVDVATMLAHLDRWVGAHDALSVYWFPFTDTCSVMTWDATDQPIDYGWPQRIRDQLFQVVGEWVFGAMLVFLIDHGFRWLTPVQTRLVAWSMGPRLDIKSPIDAGHYFFSYHPVQDSGWAVPIARSAEAFELYQSTIAQYQRDDMLPINMVVHMRFVKGSGAYLSPALGRDSCYIEAATSVKAAHSGRFYREIEARMLGDFGGRPHWAKLWWDPEHIARLHGERGEAVKAFLAVRQDIDPDGVFLNDLVARVLHLDRDPSG